MQHKPTMLRTATNLSLCWRHPMKTAREVVGTTKKTIQR